MGVITTSTDAATTARESRWEWFWSNLVNLALAVSTGFALFDTGQSVAARFGTVGIAAGLAVWHWWWRTRHPHWDEQLAPMSAYFIGLLVLGGVLLTRSDAYGLLVFVLLVQPFVIFPGRWPVAGVVAGAATALIASGSLSDDARGWPSDVGWTVVNVLFASTIGLFIRHITMQNEARRQTLAELATAHAELEASAAVTATLQAQLLAQAREAGVHDERQRIAGEIHDTLAQGLTGIITQLEAADRTLSGADSEHREHQRHIAEAKRLARESLADARRSVQALRPARLESARLADALSEVVEEWSATHGIPVEVVTTGVVRRMHPEVEVTLLRAAQEGLANVAKHARAQRVGLTLSYMDDVVTLDVRDDGRGFDPVGQPTGDGFGLTAMRERVQRLGGLLTIESIPGEGTAISARVPAVPLGASP